jgi:DNA-binding phage protein
MPLTRDFTETIKARAGRDAEFRRELLSEGVETFLSGDIDTGKAILRDYINATVGFGPLGKALGLDPKSLMRMLGPSGNPKTDNFVEIIKYLQEREGVRLEVKAAMA